MSRQSTRILVSAAVVAALLAPAASVLAEASGSAKGTLTVQGEDKPLSVELKHAYLVSGPATFDQTQMARRIVFTANDERSTIVACKDIRCATLLSADGVTVELPPDSAPGWWAHVGTVQYSSTGDSDALKLSTDSAERLAGTFTIDRTMVTTAIAFDAVLVKTFANAE